MYCDAMFTILHVMDLKLKAWHINDVIFNI